METNFTCEHINTNFTHKFLPAVYMAVFIIGLFGNCCGLKFLYANWKTFGNVNVFVLHLCVADILYLLTLPFLVAYYAADSTWIFGQVFCKITRFCFNMNLYGCIGFLTCISVYRYLGIVHTLKVKDRITVWHSSGIAFLVWLLVFVQTLPDMFFDKMSVNSSGCYDTTSNNFIDDYLKYSIGRTVIGFIIPLLIMLGCYGHVAMVLATKTNDVDVVLKRRCLRLVVVLTVLFSVCFIPYHIFRNLNLGSRVLKKQGTCLEWFADIYIANQVSRGLACMNSAINPLVYLCNSDVLLMKLHRLCGRRMWKPAYVLTDVYNSPNQAPTQQATL